MKLTSFYQPFNEMITKFGLSVTLSMRSHAHFLYGNQDKITSQIEIVNLMYIIS